MPDSGSQKPAGNLDLLRPLRQGAPWRLAAVVGTMINIYGQLLVPWLYGEPSVLGALHERAVHHPGTVALSVTLGYLFPLVVSVYSAAAARRS